MTASFFLTSIGSQTIIQHVENGNLPTAEPTSACSASLRLLSTLAARYESQSERFLDSVSPVLDMISRMTILSPPLQAPVSILVNCLPVLPLQKKDDKDISTAAIDKLLEILKECIDFYGPKDQESEFLPLLLALNNLSLSETTTTTTTSSGETPGAGAKARLQEKLIPTDEDRKEALGKGATLPHKLLHLCNNSMFPEVRELIMNMYFNLSDKDSSHFVHNVGFGNAAGYLSTKGIQISLKDLVAAGDAAANGGGGDDGDVNPITGQRLDSESHVEMPFMTDEEKEREAERLFVLFERYVSYFLSALTITISLSTRDNFSFLIS